MKSTTSFLDKISQLKNALETADAVLIGAGAGLSTAAGMFYSGERFQHYFADFQNKYGIQDMYSGGFYPFQTLEEYWAWWSRHIWVNRYEPGATQVYKDLLEAVKTKDYFVLTTNVDHQFQLAGFDKTRLYYTQGDYGLLQCSRGCHQKTYDNEDLIREMFEQQENMCIPSDLIPYCPKCGAPMAPNLRVDNTFVEDEGWHTAAKRYQEFIDHLDGKKVLLLELGVGGNTPVIIKYPFWRMTASNPDITYACLNFGEAYVPQEIADQSIALDADIRTVLEQLLESESSQI